MICSNLEVHTVGATKSVEYRWYWVLGDLFHITVGVLFSFALLATYALTTRYANRVVDVALQRCDELHMPMDRRAVLASGLQSVISGVNVAGVSITGEFCVMFFWAMLLTLWSSLSSAVEEL